MNIIFLGPPGSGKGTQAQIIAEKFRLVKLSSGDMLREAVTEGGELGTEIKEIMKAGKLVSDAQIIKIISNRISHNDCKSGFILDGFPRTIDQAISLDETLIKNNFMIDKVIELKVDEEMLIERICNRYNCVKCGASYNYKTKPTMKMGICDYCGSTEFSVRNDDTADTLKSRLNSYRLQTEPLSNYYNNKKNLYIIDGMQPENVVTKEIMNLLQK